MIILSDPTHLGPGNPIQPKRALDIACQIALALEAAHETGIVHRDLWIVERATDELRQLTDDPAHDWDPAFSPDNQHIM